MLIQGRKEDERKRIDGALDWPPDLEHWGETVDAEAGQNAMMQMLGDR